MAANRRRHNAALSPNFSWRQVRHPPPAYLPPPGEIFPPPLVLAANDKVIGPQL